MSLVFDCSNPKERSEGISLSVNKLKQGELVVIPTDTVYGIACDAFRPDAVSKLLKAKNRGPDMPVPVLVSSISAISGLTFSIPKVVNKLMEHFWPGALSIIIDAAPSLSWNLGETDGTVLVRMPAHPVALEIIENVGPLAVSSANISGQPPATDVDEAIVQLENSVSIFLNGGQCTNSVPSTIIDVSERVKNQGIDYKIVRQGALEVSLIEKVIKLE